MAGRGLTLKAVVALEAKQFKNGINAIQRQLKSVGSFMKGAFALGSVAAWGRQLIVTSKDFEDSMARVQAVSNATRDEFNMMRQEAIRLGATTRYTASQVANTLEVLTRNGLNARKATSSLASVLQLAQANAVELKDAGNILTNTMNMFSLSIADTQRINDIYSSTVSNTATNLLELYDAMVNAAPMAHALGISLEETAAALGALAQRGIKGADAGTQLRMSLQKLVDPSAIKKMKEFGITLDENEVRAKGLGNVLKELNDANLSVGNLNEIFTVRSSKSVLQLVNSMQDFNDILEIVQNSEGTTERMFIEGVGEVRKEIDILKSKYESFLITLGSKTSGVIKGGIRWLQNLISNFQTLGGTLSNISVVVVPLLIQGITKMRIAIQQAATSTSAAISLAGGWVTAIATVVTVVATSLVGAWHRATEAIREAEKHMAETRKESARLHDEVRGLAEAIGDGSNAASVNGAVKRAIDLFPEFEQVIRNAHQAAGETGNYQHLIDVLNQVLELQDLIGQSNVQQEIANANAKTMAGNIWKSTSWWTRDSAKQPYWRTATNIREQFEEKGVSKDYIKAFFEMLSQQVVKYFPDKTNADGSVTSGEEQRIKAIVGLFKQYQIKIDEAQVRQLVKDITSKVAVQTGNYGVAKQQDATKGYTAGKEAGEAAGAAREEINTKSWDLLYDDFLRTEAKFIDDFNKGVYEAKEKLHEAAQMLYDKMSDLNPTASQNEVMQQLLAKYPIPSRPGAVQTKEPNGKTEAEKFQDVLDKYSKDITSLERQYKMGTISFEEYFNGIAKTTEEAWKSILAFENLEAILKKLNKEDQALVNTIGVHAQRLKRAEDADKMIEQTNELSKYQMPNEKSRDTSFDYMKTDKEKKEEEVRIKLDYAEALEKLVEDLKEAIKDGDFDLVTESAEAMLSKFIEKAKEAKEAANELQDKINYSEIITKLDEQLTTLHEKQISNISQLSNAFDNLYRAIQSIGEVFGEEIEWEGLEKMITLINAAVQIMETFKTITEAVKIAQDIASKKKVKNNLAEAMSNQAVTSTELQKAAAEGMAAAAGGAESVSSIPIVGPVLAVAAVAAIVAALMAGFSKFAKGGIVGGNSTQGDKNFVRANSGEMILTKGQQGTLYKALATGNLGGGNVEFKIRGGDLVGALNNYNRIHG